MNNEERKISEESKNNLIRLFPYGNVWRKRRIKGSYNPNNWYADKIGLEVTVKVFGSYGAYDDQDRWISYYDLSEPIE